LATASTSSSFCRVSFARLAEEMRLALLAGIQAVADDLPAPLAHAAPRGVAFAFARGRMTWRADGAKQAK